MKHRFMKIKAFFSKFRNKLFANFIVIAVIPILIVGSLSYVLAYHIAKDRIIDSVSYTSTQLNTSLAERFTQMEDAANVMEYYMYTLILQSDTSLSEQLSTYSNVRNSLFNLSRTFEFGNVSVYTNDQFIFSNEGITFFSFDDLSMRGITIEEMEQQANQLNWSVMHDIKEPFVKYKSNASNHYVSVSKAFQLANKDTLEYIFFIDIPVAEIAKLLEERAIGTSINAYLLDENGQLIIGEDQFVDREMLSEQLNTSDIGKNSTLTVGDATVIIQRNPITQWLLVTEVPNQYIRSNTSVLISILLITLVLTVVVAIISSLFISHNLSKRVNKIAEVIDKIKSNNHSIYDTNMVLPVSNKPEFHDEFDRLSLVFNDMTKKLREDFEQILTMRKMEEKMQFELQQSKINPHFLYNVLDSIKNCQTSGNIEEANQMISRLAKFYRLLLKKENELIPIQEELEIATLFMEIEHINKTNSFTWEIHTDDMIEKFLLPKFVLQPIIENCLKHALYYNGDILHIVISLVYEEDYILIQVKDNGQGIGQEQLMEIRQVLATRKMDSRKFFGLSNVNYRVASFSKCEEPLKMISTPNQGTLVEIRMDQMFPEDGIEEMTP
ncbi:sensor histidine kinase [Gracilibacillus alcaliphilus]|uniref:sensor histidine kinase n=1 Tax=Gracilibacillus alcaliphilus TaxID=1401441 RepID=UPI00195C7D38|nr:histidine kinase [Gracilibacillus alcaliphilus]MBM7677673.1 two-component system sensor histidine kinase YesM [Gracilibacillus alcaliphilus]